MEGSFHAKESSNLDWVRYEGGALYVDFKNKEGVKVSTYRYDGTLEKAQGGHAAGSNPTGMFPFKMYERLRDAVSPGRCFAYEIRPVYKGVKQ